MFSFNEMPTAVSSLFSAYASFAASMMLIRSMAHELIPHPLQSYLYSVIHYLFTPLSNNLTLIIDEDWGMARNQVYDAAELYLSTKIGPDTDRFRVSKTQRQKNFAFAIEKGQEITDQFNNFQLKWRFVCVEPQNQNQNGRFNSERRSFELTFHKKFKDRVMNLYLPYVLDRANQIRNEQRVLKLYNRECPYELDGSGGGTWGSVNLEHPATFETLAIDHKLKKFIIQDLDRFVRRKEFYKKVGKAWKRAYLLYGPPGTGKSSLIAAMANYLKFDIYDLELTSLYSNSDLRRVLLSTSNRSILVIEDIDCSVEVKDRQNDECLDLAYVHPPNTKLTLSGLLNFIDGLWSSCGDERIIVFTTNHKEKLDPALLRPGRMDVHINMSYCSGEGFQLLASNYLGLHATCQNPLYQEAQRLIETIKVTPAEVAEELMKSDDSCAALEGLTSFLKRKRIENENVKDEKVGQIEGTVDKSEVKKAKKLKSKQNTGRLARKIRRVIRCRHRRGGLCV